MEILTSSEIQSEEQFRVSSFCDTDEILVDNSIYRDVVRDFNLRLKIIDFKTSNKKYEFDIGEQLYSLKEAKYNDLANAPIILKHFGRY